MQLILPVSSWAFWAGLLSNASEIHVNGQPHHPNMGASMPQYVYHLEKAKSYFGRFNTTTNDIEYELDITKIPKVIEPTPSVTKPVQSVVQSVMQQSSSSALGTVTEADLAVAVTMVNLTETGFIFD